MSFKDLLSHALLLLIIVISYGCGFESTEAPALQQTSTGYCTSAKTSSAGGVTTSSFEGCLDGKTYGIRCSGCSATTANCACLLNGSPTGKLATSPSFCSLQSAADLSYVMTVCDWKMQ